MQRKLQACMWLEFSFREVLAERKPGPGRKSENRDSFAVLRSNRELNFRTQFKSRFQVTIFKSRQVVRIQQSRSLDYQSRSLEPQSRSPVSQSRSLEPQSRSPVSQCRSLEPQSRSPVSQYRSPDWQSRLAVSRSSPSLGVSQSRLVVRIQQSRRPDREISEVCRKLTQISRKMFSKIYRDGLEIYRDGLETYQRFLEIYRDGPGDVSASF